MTPAQLQTLKNAINNNPTWAAFVNNGDGNYALADVLNTAASPTMSVWRTETPITDIADAIDWSKYTPTSLVDDATLTLALTANQRMAQLLAIQTKQMNLQLMLQGRTTLDCSKANIRAGLRDAVISVPSGSAGAGTAPGGSSGTTVLNVCTRLANEVEKIFATGPATTGAVTAYLLGYEGKVDYVTIGLARNS